MCVLMQKNPLVSMAELLILVLTVSTLFPGAIQGAALPGGDDERYGDKEYSSPTPGAHELATWLIAQLRQTNQPTTATVSGCRYPSTGKRNSEIINSLMRLPQMDSGRK